MTVLLAVLLSKAAIDAQQKAEADALNAAAVDSKALEEPWFKCVLDKARAFSTLPEAAKDVADAALSGCASLQDRYQHAIFDPLSKVTTEQTATDVSTRATSERRARMREIIVSAVMGLRVAAEAEKKK